MRIGLAEIVATLKELVNEFLEDQVMEMAAATAFRLILALPPLVLFFAALSSVAARYTGVDAFDWLQRQVQSAPLPVSVQETIQLLLDTVERESSPELASFGILLTLWAASGAVDTLILALNRAYDVTDARPYVKRRLLSISLTIALSLLTITAFILFVFGERLGRWLANLAGLGPTFTTIWNIARWPVLILFVVIAIASLYSIGPALPLRFRWFSLGAALATGLWLLATWGFSLYLEYFNPGSAYGALGALIVLLFFLYISSIVLLVGAEVNAVLDKRYDPQVVAEKAAHPEQQTDPAEAQARATELAEHIHTSPAALGVTPGTRRAAEKAQAASDRQIVVLAPPPDGGESHRAAQLVLALALASLFATAFLRALRSRS